MKSLIYLHNCEISYAQFYKYKQGFTMARRGGMGAGDYGRLQNSKRTRNWAGAGILAISLTGAFFYADKQTSFIRDNVQRVTQSHTKSAPYWDRLSNFASNTASATITAAAPTFTWAVNSISAALEVEKTSEFAPLTSDAPQPKPVRR